MKLVLLSALVIAGATAFPEKRNTGCSTVCPMFVIEFCGSDGKTYHSNECFVKSRMCLQGLLGYDDFKTLHMGACTGKELIDVPQPVTDAPQDVPEKRSSQCNTFCPMYMVEFCGSDGKTYTSNECFIKSRMCTQGLLGYENFKTLHMGACTGKELIDEPQPATDAPQGVPEKRNTRCSRFCPMYMVQFCGSDGKTYTSNECFIKSSMCSQGLLGYEDFKMLHMGACTGKELTATSQTTTDAPIVKRNAKCNSFCPMYIIEFCGSDGKTYHSNECFIKSRMCAEGLLDSDNFKSLHYGACTGKELIDEQKPATTAAP